MQSWFLYGGMLFVPLTVSLEQKVARMGTEDQLKWIASDHCSTK